MYQYKRQIYILLFLIFFVLEAIHLFGYVIPDEGQLALIKPFGHYAPLALAFLMLFVIKISEHEKEKLDISLISATGLVEKLSGEFQRLTELTKRADNISEEIRSLANRLQSSDALLHGKLFFFQRRYEDAISVFEEMYRHSPNDQEVNRWLGLSLLRNRQPKKAVPLLEFAARERQNDPEIWYASGEAKYRLWDPEYFSSAEDDIKKALELGLRQKEIAQVILAKLLLTRDRTAAITTLEEALAQNRTSTAVIRELARIYSEEQNWNKVIDITDQALAINRRNWNLYPVRAEAFIRRDESGDLDRAKFDLSEAREANPRDFGVYRVEVELLLSKARKSGSEAEKRSIYTSARGKIAKAEGMLRGGFKAQANALRAKISLLLGDLDDAVSSARRAIEIAASPYPNNQLLLCAALAFKHSWVLLSKHAQEMRKVFPVPALKIWASLYVLMAGLFSSTPLSELSEEVEQLGHDLATFPGFDPTMRSEWAEVTWEFPLKEIKNQSEKKLAQVLLDYLKGHIQYSAFMFDLKVIQGYD